MKVTLAGYNADVDSLAKHKRESALLTPETISAAYARISRSRKSVTALREEARQAVKQARLSNRTIIFEMGHHSIAEHAIFNFDIIGISRLAVEELEAYRLCSYTEKSQRYVTLHGDFVIPGELRNRHLKTQYVETIQAQNVLYKKLYEKITRYNIGRHSRRSLNTREKRTLQNLAKEDARYALSLATQAQLGATINARNLELMIRRFASHPLFEINVLGQKLYKTVKKIAPSVILFCNPNEHDRKTYSTLHDFARRVLGKNRPRKKRSDVVLVDCTRSGDERILSALLFKTSQNTYPQCREAVRKMPKRKKQELFKKSCRHVELYDVLLREFEYAYLTYALTVSAACFGQLKRHRIATLSSQGYDISLGVVVPESVKRINEEKSFMDVVSLTEKTYERIQQEHGGVASYILTNAHQKNVLISCNMRELYHISRLREDSTAQWDIRGKVNKMTRLAKSVMPIVTQLLGGKDEYPLLYRRLYGRNPKITKIPEP